MSNVLQAARRIIDRWPIPASMVEIGTADGRDLGDLCTPMLGSLRSIDPMYDWVPDVPPDEPFDPARVSDAKVALWHKNARELLHPDTYRWLIIGKSSDVARDGHPELEGEFDILVIDGCHHPASAVEADYWDFRRWLAPHHAVLFDDINHHSPGMAFKAVIERLEAEGGGHRWSDEGGYVGIVEVG